MPGRRGPAWGSTEPSAHSPAPARTQCSLSVRARCQRRADSRRTRRACGRRAPARRRRRGSREAAVRQHGVQVGLHTHAPCRSAAQQVQRRWGAAARERRAPRKSRAAAAGSTRAPLQAGDQRAVGRARGSGPAGEAADGQRARRQPAHLLDLPRGVHVLPRRRGSARSAAVAAAQAAGPISTARRSGRAYRMQHRQHGREARLSAQLLQQQHALGAGAAVHRHAQESSVRGAPGAVCTCAASQNSSADRVSSTSRVARAGPPPAAGRSLALAATARATASGGSAPAPAGR